MRRRLALAWVFPMVVGASSAHAGELPGAADTARILETIEAGQVRLTPADRRHARQATTDGDRAYRRRNYRAAFTEYSNAYPNAPSAYAYLMAGDTYLRMFGQ